MLKIPNIKIPITEISLPYEVKLFIKREDLIHQEISGNKYWKLFHNVNHYLSQQPENPLLISFGGAFSNHIAALAALGKNFNIKTIGIIRGDELKEKWNKNPTLTFAHRNKMDFRFVTRTEYKDKKTLTQRLQNEFPNALIIPEGGTNSLAVEGIKNMLNSDTQEFDYLCTAVGTGGTIAGLSKFAKQNQKVLGFKTVDDDALEAKIKTLSGRNNFSLFDAHFGGYGKILDKNISFINEFKNQYHIPLDPIYTGKMMMKLIKLIENQYFPKSSKILAFHTGGLQGIYGANELLKKQRRILINT